MVSPAGLSSSLEILLAAGALLQPPTLGVKVEVVTIHHEKTSAKKIVTKSLFLAKLRGNPWVEERKLASRQVLGLSYLHGQGLIGSPLPGVM